MQCLLGTVVRLSGAFDWKILFVFVGNIKKRSVFFQEVFKGFMVRIECR